MKRFSFFICLFSVFLISGCGSNADDSMPAEEFTNRQGSEASICAHEGCNNHIAASGDTAYCIEHSGLCTECGCYVDEDASLCTKCIIMVLDASGDYSFASNTYEFNS